MLGKSYMMGRHLGRISQDHSMRMSNRAEVGLGMIGLIAILFIFGMIFLAL